MAIRGISAQFNAASITDAQWDSAERYFAQNPTHAKIRRKEQDAPLPFSFIKVDGVLYAMDREYLGSGNFNKAKKGITRKGEIVKINISATENVNDANEKLVAEKIGEYKGKVKTALATKKEFWKHLIGTDEQKEPFMVDQKTYTVLRFHEGQELWKALTSTDFSLIERMVIAVQCAKAVQEFHRLRIIHRDIKPENFIIDVRDFTVSLIDFGFSRFLPKELEQIQDEDIVGTPGYMAPEICQFIKRDGTIRLITDNKLYSFDSDTYALGEVFNDLGLDSTEFRADYIKDMKLTKHSIRPALECVIDSLKKDMERFSPTEYTKRLKDIVMKPAVQLDKVLETPLPLPRDPVPKAVIGRPLPVTPKAIQRPLPGIPAPKSVERPLLGIPAYKAAERPLPTPPIQRPLPGTPAPKAVERQLPATPARPAAPHRGVLLFTDAVQRELAQKITPFELTTRTAIRAS